MSDEGPGTRLRHQLESRGITDERVLDAIEDTPRELFVPHELRHLAYADEALAIGSDQTISQPYMVATMTEQLSLEGDELVLEIGTGSGYQAAILSQLCGKVVTVERLPELSERARQILTDSGYANIEFWVGDGTLGCPERAPFDRIIVTAAAPQLPQPLYDQLRLGGEIVIPIGDEQLQRLALVRKTEHGPDMREGCGCRFVKLIGEAGWSDN